MSSHQMQSQTSECPARRDWPESSSHKANRGTETCRIESKRARVQLCTEGDLWRFDWRRASDGLGWKRGPSGRGASGEEWAGQPLLRLPWGWRRWRHQEVSRGGRPQPAESQEEVPWTTSGRICRRLLHASLRARFSDAPSSSGRRDGVQGFPSVGVEENHTGSGAAYSRETGPETPPRKQ